MAKTAKQARLVGAKSRAEAPRIAQAVAASPYAPDARPKFSREMALFWLNGLEEQFNDIASVAISGLAYQKTRYEDCKDPVMCSLLRVIQEQTDSSVKVSNELRTMLETLPKEEKHG
jgi:hypothetical protein